MSAEKGRPTGCNCRASDINFPYKQESMPCLILTPLSDDRNSRKSRNHLSRTRIFRFLPMLTIIGPKRLGIGIITLGHGVTQPIRLGPTFRKSSKRVARLLKQKNGLSIFSAAVLRKILKVTDVQFKAMILLAINCGFGNADYAKLSKRAINLKTGWVNYLRLFNVMGVINYLVQMNADSLDSFPEFYRPIIEGRPAWVTAAFAIAVFGSSLGCLLLLLRKSAAFYTFITSLLGVIVSMVHILNVAGLRSLEVWIGVLMQLVVTAFLVWYTKYSGSKGWIS